MIPKALGPKVLPPYRAHDPTHTLALPSAGALGRGAGDGEAGGRHWGLARAGTSCVTLDERLSLSDPWGPLPRRGCGASLSGR